MGYLNTVMRLLLVALLIILTGCATSSTSQKSTSEGSDGSEYMTLEDHLRRINGIQITGSGSSAKVILRPRGISNASRGMGEPDSKTDMNLGDSNDRQPLFVVDGQKMGRDYSDVRDMFSAGEIKSVRLLPESEASQYGNEGGSGVIEIVSQSSNDS